ncbi:single-stranded DNA-binding protein [uncultured Selenomonas sp.]|uniref:single-stranded DNA-binding protein n=1 Tax=uncultured Selenomonas sp. TaxID=159275 RepID=UPI0028F06FA9|nr:single-stranded DNA-binding protein [uncultured Selenomonas sp.]
MNIIIVSGRLGADVREYTTPSGKTVVHFPLAVRKSFKKDERGEYPVNYFKIEVWGAVAESCKKYLGKGQLVNVRGRLDTGTYIDKTNGEARHYTVIVAAMVEFLSPRRYNGGQSAPPEDLADESLYRQVMEPYDEDDLPF